MKSIYQAVRNGNGYVRMSHPPLTTEAGKPSALGILLAGALIAVTGTFVCLMLLGK